MEVLLRDSLLLRHLRVIYAGRDENDATACCGAVASRVAAHGGGGRL